jgi:hypothetical protein
MAGDSENRLRESRGSCELRRTPLEGDACPLKRTRHWHVGRVRRSEVRETSTLLKMSTPQTTSATNLQALSTHALEAIKQFLS